jgi:hypothetical protein
VKKPLLIIGATLLTVWLVGQWVKSRQLAGAAAASGGSPSEIERLYEEFTGQSA